MGTFIPMREEVVKEEKFPCIRKTPSQAGPVGATEPQSAMQQ